MAKKNSKIFVDDDFFIINKKTGEVLQEVTPQNDLMITITSRNKNEYVEKKLDEKLFDIKYSNFGRVNFDKLIFLSKLKLNGSDYSILNYIIASISYQKNISKQGKTRYSTLDSIAKHLKYDKRTVEKSLNVLEKNNVIVILEKKIYVNPYISHKGNGTEIKTIDLFTECDNS